MYKYRIQEKADGQFYPQKRHYLFFWKGCKWLMSEEEDASFRFLGDAITAVQSLMGESKRAKVNSMEPQTVWRSI